MLFCMLHDLVHSEVNVNQSIIRRERERERNRCENSLSKPFCFDFLLPKWLLGRRETAEAKQSPEQFLNGIISAGKAERLWRQFPFFIIAATVSRGQLCHY